MKRFVLFAYVAAVHAALAAVAFVPRLASSIQYKLGIFDASPVREAQDVLALRLDPVVPAGSAIFLGDSITQALPVSAVATRAVNFGIGSQNTQQLSAMLSRLNSQRFAARVYLNIGTNDIGPHKSGYSAEDMATLIALIPTTVPLVWSSIMPRAGLEKEIGVANRSIASMCAARPLCTYVDTHATMTTEAGTPQPDIYIDSVHPNAKGYSLWIAAMKAAAP